MFGAVVDVMVVCIVGPKDLKVELVADKEDIFVTRIAISAPKYVAITFGKKEVGLPTPGLLHKILKGATSTVLFSESLLYGTTT